MRTSLTLLIVIFVSLSAAAPRAQTATESLAQLGLLGRWSVQCAKSPSGTNPHIFFERSNSGTGARFRVEFGSGAPPLTDHVESARLVRFGTIAIRTTALQPGDLSFEITILKEPSRLRTIESVGSDGKVYIRDGVVMDTGEVNPWQNKCAGEARRTDQSPNAQAERRRAVD